ncbi:hypothetical protein L6452_34176 [Arctium lappa]|uniref:Uncharacterized protein n=1 Tax=Arctium lappa TaxID=4217 RepID=A0ACB8YHG0_ARCLA|nr:hypothetical protein L6452_34176 [Arctium lappa]
MNRYRTQPLCVTVSYFHRLITISNRQIGESQSIIGINITALSVTVRLWYVALTLCAVVAVWLCAVGEQVPPPVLLLSTRVNSKSVISSILVLPCPLFVTCATVALCDCAAVDLCGCGFVGCGFVDSTIDHRHHCINIFLGSPVQQPAGVFFPSF